MAYSGHGCHARFSAANLADDDPVGTVPECGLEQVGEADLALVGVELSFGVDDGVLRYNSGDPGTPSRWPR